MSCGGIKRFFLNSFKIFCSHKDCLVVLLGSILPYQRVAMEVDIPGLYSDESRVIWCPKLGRGDLGTGPADGSSQQLINKAPVWNEQVRDQILANRAH